MSKEEVLADLLPDGSCVIGYPTNLDEYVGQIIAHALLTYNMRVAHDEEPRGQA